MRKYQIAGMHDGYAIESTTASDDDIDDGVAVWSIVSGWDTIEDARAELARLMAD